jgi:hypothetical protein
MWTIQKVKDELPPIKARWNGNIYDAKISGRKADFPMVTIWINKRDYITCEFAWQTLVNSLNGKGIVTM